MQTIAGQDSPLINVSRALNRLKSVFVTLHKNYGATARLRGGNFTADRRQWNDLFRSLSWDNADGTLTHSPAGEFEFQLQLGSKLFPEYPIRSHNEAYYQLEAETQIHR